MGFMKKFLSLGKRNKKRTAPDVDALDPVVSSEYMSLGLRPDEDTEATFTRILRSTPARISDVVEIDAISRPTTPMNGLSLGLPTLSPPTASPQRRRSASTAPFSEVDDSPFDDLGPYRNTPSGSRLTYSVTILGRTRTEPTFAIPAAIPACPPARASLELETEAVANRSTHSNSTFGGGRTPRPRSRSLPLKILTQTPRTEREGRLTNLRSDPSVATLLDLYDHDGHVNSGAFANSPGKTVQDRTEDDDSVMEDGRLQSRRTGSTLRQLLGAPASVKRPTTVRSETTRYSAQEGDISWAERVLGESLDPAHDEEDQDLPGDLLAEFNKAEAVLDLDKSSLTMSSLGEERTTHLFPREDSMNIFGIHLPEVHEDASASAEDTYPASLEQSLVPNKVAGPSLESTISSMEVELSQEHSSSGSDTSSSSEPETPPASEVFAFLTRPRKASASPHDKVPLHDEPPSMKSDVVMNAHEPLDVSSDDITSSSAANSTHETAISAAEPVQLVVPASSTLCPNPSVKRKRSESSAASSSKNTRARKVTVTRASKVTMSPARSQLVSASRIPRAPKSPAPPLPVLAKTMSFNPTPAATTAQADVKQLLQSTEAVDVVSEGKAGIPGHQDIRPVEGSPEDPFTALPKRRSHRRSSSSTAAVLLDKQQRRQSKRALSVPPEHVIARMSAEPRLQVMEEDAKENYQAAPAASLPLSNNHFQGMPTTPTRSGPNHAKKLLMQLGGGGLLEPPSPASSTDLSPMGKVLMANVRQQRMQMRVRDQERARAKGRRFAGAMR